MGELEAVIALADLLEEVAVLVELEQARVAAAMVDENVSLRIGCNTDGFAEILAGRQLEEIRHRGVGDFRHVLGLGLLLRERRTDTEHEGDSGNRCNTALHESTSRDRW